MGLWIEIHDRIVYRDSPNINVLIHTIDYDLGVVYSVKGDDFISALVAICLIKASYFTVDILTVIALYYHPTLLTLDR